MSNAISPVRFSERLERARSALGEGEAAALLIGVGPEALKNVSMVGDDPKLDPGIGSCGKDGQVVPVGVGLPTVRMDGITVGGTSLG